MQNKNYIVFTDESYITNSRYRSISAVSFPEIFYNKINNTLKKILQDSSVNEFKWVKMKNAKYFFCAQKIIDFILNNLYNFQLRIDVLIWDIYDSRHDINGRDDSANYERMFFHLLKDLFKKRIKEANWKIYSDEKGDINWINPYSSLKFKGLQKKNHNLLFNFCNEYNYNLLEFKEVQSNKYFLIQVADLFAGLSVFSKQKFNNYIKWENANSSQLMLFSELEPKVNISIGDKKRFELLQYFNKRAKSMKLGISLKRKKSLYTYNVKKPINFWHYNPQGDYDKAPVKKLYFF